MRSRERLIEVLRSVNHQWHGTMVRDDFAFAAGILGSPNHFNITNLEAQKLVSGYATGHPSPHIREIAAEALHYLKQDMEAGNAHPR